jgi:rhamnulokinase
MHMKKTLNMLAFDLGASSGRIILGRFDGERISLEEIHRFPNEPVWVNNHFYWDVLRLWHEIKAGLIRAISLGIEIHSIGVDTWGVDYGLLDNQGQLLANPHHYRDQRTVPIMNELIDRHGADFLYQRSGIQFVSFNTIFQLGDDLRNRPQLMDQTAKILLMPDLINYLLTGEQAAEFSIASTTGLMNIASKSWDPDLLQTIGLVQDKLPGIISAGVRLGTLTKGLCLELGCQPIPVVAVTGHDTAAAIAAAPQSGVNAGFLSSGTWSLMGVERKEPVVTPLARSCDFTNEGGLNFAVLLFKNINALWLIQECRRIWRLKTPDLDFATISKAAAQSQPFVSLLNISDQRFFAPPDMVAEIQQYCRETNQIVPETIGDVARAIYDSLALEYRTVAEKLQVLTGDPLKTLHIVGGGSQDEFLSQLSANALQMPVTTGPIEATALGNLMIQAMSSGAVSGLEEAQAIIERSFTMKEYQSRSEIGWEEAYQKYRRICNDNGEN